MDMVLGRVLEGLKKDVGIGDRGVDLEFCT
jgi:hypothetical protein